MSDRLLGELCAACGYERRDHHGIDDACPRGGSVFTRAEVAKALSHQEGGQHYKAMKIQPFEYIHANSIPFAEGCVIKYVSRWRAKGGVEDLKKARHFLDLLIEAEAGGAAARSDE